MYCPRRHRRAPSLKRDTTGSPRAARTNYPPPPRGHLPPRRPSPTSPAPLGTELLISYAALRARYSAASRTPAMRMRFPFFLCFPVFKPGGTLMSTNDWTVRSRFKFTAGPVLCSRAMTNLRFTPREILDVINKVKTKLKRDAPKHKH